MRCAGCPLFTSWNNESDRGEACGLFGDGWDSPFQYEDKDGNIVGCYIDRHFIEKTDEAYQEHLLQEAASWEEWMLETEKENHGARNCTENCADCWLDWLKQEARDER